MLAIALIQVFSLICLKGNLERIINVYLFVQTICYLEIYKLKIPLSASIVLIRFKNMVEFSLMHPEQLIINADIMQANSREYFTDIWNDKRNNIDAWIMWPLFFLISFVCCFCFIKCCLRASAVGFKKMYEDINWGTVKKAVMRMVTVTYLYICVLVAPHIREYILSFSTSKIPTFM